MSSVNPLDVARKNLDSNLEVFEDSVKTLQELICEDEIDVDASEIELELMREQYKFLLKLIDDYINLLRTASDDDEANLQIQRKVELIRNMAFTERYCAQELKSDDDGTSSTRAPAARKSKLPKRELPKFEGDVRNWVSFWGAFEEIHRDRNLTDSEKFHYLLQSTVPDSAARKVMNSFPATGPNYAAAVARLEERFGRKKTIIKVYIRDLLNLVVDNAKKETEVDFVDLVTSIDSKIRNLHQLGVTKDKFGELLYPVVESCLPPRVLDSYLRSPGFKEELEDLMVFLQNEVRRRLETSLAKSQFLEEESKPVGKHEKPNYNSLKKKGSSSKSVPTSTGFLNTKGQNENQTCSFCQRSNHVATECRTAMGWKLEQRREALKNRNACFHCFKLGHGSKSCKKKMMCLLCGKDHHAIMCNGKVEKAISNDSPGNKPREENNDDRKSPDGTHTNMANLDARPEVLLQTLTVWVHGEKGSKKVRAAYDSLSQSSYIKEDIAKKLNLQLVGHETIVHQTFGGIHSKPQKHNIYKVEVAGLEEKKRYKYQVSGIPKISGAIQNLPRGAYISECSKKGITLTDLDSVSEEVELLIGADFGDELKLGGEFVKLEAGPVAIHTRIGWVLSGRLNPEKRNDSLSTKHINMMTMNDKDISNLWSLETIGIEDPATTQTREELEKSAVEHFNKTVRRDETGRYTVNFPWIEGHPELPSNYQVALKRLQSTTKKLKDEGILEEYDQVFQSWLKEGILERAYPDTSSTPHYLPHRAVIKEGSTTRIRPVFDASAKQKGSPSLNDCVEKGPNLLELIPAILTRFRMNKVGATADIAKAFLQIQVVKNDRDKMRLFWWEDIAECKNIVEYRHTRVMFGFSSSPFLLGVTLKHLLSKYSKYEETCKLLQHSFYVDNAVVSLPTMEQAKRFQSEAQEVLLSGCFDLRGWEFGPCSDDRDVAVLGLLWNVKEDVFRLDSKKITEYVNIPATKRNIYKLINMLFDPLGFVSPFIVCAKTLLKKVCNREKVGWDDKLPVEHEEEFQKWKNQLIDLQQIKIPRFISAIPEEAKLTLHCFCDSSKDCFASSVYLRVENEDKVDVFLVQSKTRVSPKKPVTIPRLELLSCLIGARLVNTVLKDMAMEIPVRYWSDSTTALTWIKKEDTWATFVNNRVKQIRQLSKPELWAHVPGDRNPADIPSRGCSVKKLLAIQWWNGPSWLYKSEDEWTVTTPDPDDSEVNKEKKKSVISAVNIHIPRPSEFQEKLLSLGSYTRIIRAVAYIIRFVNKLRKMEVAGDQLNSDELDVAEKYVLRFVQNSVEKFGQSKKFPLQKDDFGLLRLKTRLIHGEDERNFKYPVVLPGSHPIIKLLIQHEHELACHAGVQYLQSLLRDRYWIVKNRKSIRSVVTKCARCRRHLAKRCSAPEAALPLDRVKINKTFAITGVDLTGPLFVEKGKKMWVVLFTCGVYRAVHMELVSSLTTEAFLGAFRKFVARRGRPHTVYSDNGTNFTGTSQLLKNVKWEEVLRYAAVRRIKWRFNPPSAAWWGGWWERLIGLTKQLLRRVLGSRKVKQAQLEVLITEVESVLNDRPLTYIAEDPDDLRPLTPACFLRDIPVAVLPEVDVSDGKGLRLNLNKIKKMRQELRERFRREYLGQLLHHGKNTKALPINVGDVVLVEMDNQKRVDWPIGVVLETFPGRDGIVRVAKLKTTKGTMVRPLQRLFPLEVKTSGGAYTPELLQRVQREAPAEQDEDQQNNFDDTDFDVDPI